MRISKLVSKLTAHRWQASILCMGAILCGGQTSSPAASPPVLPPLSTISGSPRLPGKFVWADLVTDNVPAAQQFYSRLFGWTFQSAGAYLIASNNERPLCGMFQRPRPKDRQALPRWFAYL